MSENTATTQETAPKGRSGKVRAILAGGLVLGLGATGVLAAWNDSEFAIGNFNSGSFNLEGSLDGTAFAEHDSSAAAATLAFTINPTNLAPEDVVYAPFAVRLDGPTTSAATVTVTSTATGGNAANLSYELTAPTAFGYSAADASTSLVPAATAVTTAGAAGTFDLDIGAGAAAGDAVNLCFKVTAGDDLLESTPAVVTWQFAAASVAP